MYRVFSYDNISFAYCLQALMDFRNIKHFGLLLNIDPLHVKNMIFSHVNEWFLFNCLYIYTLFDLVGIPSLVYIVTCMQLTTQ